MKTQLAHTGRSYGVEIHEFNDIGRQLCFVASCGKCHDRVWVGKSSDIRLPPDVVHELFRKRGWEIGKTARQNLCPNCLHPTEKLMGSTIVADGFHVPSITSVIAITPPPPPQPKETEAMAVLQSQKPRPLTGAETRHVSALLEEHFDEKTGKYDDKWDDQVIADKVNVPRLSVANLRIEGWGQIRAFPDIEALKSEAIELRSMLNDFDHRIREAERRRLGA